MRIGLLAMSGIRVQDQELLALGLTLPGFVERSKVIASLPSLGLLTLAGMTPARHGTVYLEIDAPRALAQLPGPFDLVAISTYSAQVFEAYELADRYRAAGVPVLIGGPHATALPGEALAHADAVAAGEGEPVWARILEDAEAGRMRGVYRSGTPFDLGMASMPAFEKLEVPRYNRFTIQASRGCPHQCEFCASSPVVASSYTHKPVGKVVAEIDRVFGLWPRPFIEFADDNMFADRAYGRELMEALGTRNFRWFAETDLSVAEDEELLDRIRASGCIQLLVGLESPVEAGLEGLELRGDWKHRQWAKYREAIRRIQSRGVTVNGCFVLGLDGHTPEIFEQVFEFVRDSGLYEVQVTMLTAFPGTPLLERLRREGRILEEGRWDLCTLFDVNYRPTGMSPGELRSGFRDLVTRLYSEAFTRSRKEGFHLRWREARRGRA